MKALVNIAALWKIHITSAALLLYQNTLIYWNTLLRIIPLELIRNSTDSVRKAREAYLIDKAKTLEPLALEPTDATNFSKFLITS